MRARDCPSPSRSAGRALDPTRDLSAAPHRLHPLLAGGGTHQLHPVRIRGKMLAPAVHRRQHRRRHTGPDDSPASRRHHTTPGHGADCCRSHRRAATRVGPKTHPSRTTALPRCTAKRRRLSPPDPALLFAPTPIPTLPSAPSLSSYIKLHKDRPFILREYATSGLSSPSWPAIHRWRSPDYLLDTVGEGRVVPVEIGAAYDEEGWGQRIVPLRDMMARAGYDVAPETPGADSGPPLYLAQHSLLEQFPELGGDICMPDYVWSNPAPDRAPATDDGIIINVWLGSASSEVISPAHTVRPPTCTPAHRRTHTTIATSRS
jgi:hypothetical protein